MKPIKKFFKEPVFWIGFDLFVWVPFHEMQKMYTKSRYIISLQDMPQIDWRSINDLENWYNIIWIENHKWWLPIFVHELVHQLHFQLKYNNVWYWKQFEIFAYLMQYFVRELNIYLDKRKSLKTKKKKWMN